MALLQFLVRGRSLSIFFSYLITRSDNRPTKPRNYQPPIVRTSRFNEKPSFLLIQFRLKRGEVKKPRRAERERGRPIVRNKMRRMIETKKDNNDAPLQEITCPGPAARERRLRGVRW